MKFSVILPVRNGGEYIKECVQSILSQTLEDYELLIFENDSSDGTYEWLQTLTDPRIRIYPAETSLTIEENWSRITTIPKNEFITLIGHDDILDPDYLHTMHGLIRQHPGATLFQTHFSYIDATGNNTRNCLPMPGKMTAAQFLERFLKKEIDVMGTGFMIRSKDYDRLGGFPDYPNLLFADFELWIRLAEKGYLAVSPANRFSFRIHQSMTIVSPDTKYQQAFGRFMNFMAELRSESQELKNVIEKDIQPYLINYCRGLSHRLLRTPKDKRDGLTVQNFIRQCELYAKMLGVEKKFKPGKEPSIRLAKHIDHYGFTRWLFLLFKKIFPRPVLK